MPKGSAFVGPHWLIVKQDGLRMEVLSVNLDGYGEALAVFSFEEEAEMFLRLRVKMSEANWTVRQTSGGELVSVLYGPCSGANRVVLDPLPEACGGVLNGLLSIDRDDFLQILLMGKVPSLPRSVAPQKVGSFRRISGVDRRKRDPERQARMLAGSTSS